MTQHETIQARLSAYYDGDLAASERSEVEAHLARCDRCLAELAAIGELLEEARALPRDIAPPRDLWTGIAARITSEAGRSDAGAGRVVEVDFTRRRGGGFPIWALRLAAAVTLVVVSSGVTAWVLRPSASAPYAAAPAERTRQDPAPAQIGFASTEAAFEGIAGSLESELEARRHLLSPETIATVEDNLRIIDEAIAEARAALEADPGNRELPLILTGVYRQKVHLLRTAVQLSQTS